MLNHLVCWTCSGFKYFLICLYFVKISTETIAPSLFTCMWCRVKIIRHSWLKKRQDWFSQVKTFMIVLQCFYPIPRSKNLWYHWIRKEHPKLSKTLSFQLDIFCRCKVRAKLGVVNGLLKNEKSRQILPKSRNLAQPTNGSRSLTFRICRSHILYAFLSSH